MATHPHPQQSPPDPALRPPRRRRKAARAGEIIAAGLAHFAEHGYANTRLEDVAGRAGIAKSTVYLYFDSKEALFEATVRAHLTPAFEDLDALLDTGTGDVESLLRSVLVRAYEGFIRPDNLALIRIILTEGDRFPELRRAFYETEMASGKALLSGIVERGVALGEFTGEAALEFPRLLVAPVFTAAVWRMSFETLEPVDLERWMAAHVTLLMNGLRVR